MKKLLMMFAVAAMMVLTTSCGGHDNSPKGVAEAAVKCMANKDYKGYMNLTNATDQQKEAMAAMLEKVGQEGEQKGGMKKFEIVDENIDEENGKATVSVKIVYENGEEETKDMKMVKKDGDWLLSADK